MGQETGGTNPAIPQPPQELTKIPPTVLERSILDRTPELEKQRRDAVLGLSHSLLQQLNPTLSSERIDELFFSEGDILALPWDRTYSPKSHVAELAGWRSAVNIARFYWAVENRDLPVPERAIIIKSTSNPDSGRIPTEKALMYIDAGLNDTSLPVHDSDIMRFQETLKTGLLKKESAVPPDVYLNGHYGEKMLSNTKRKEFAIQGADTLLVGDYISYGHTRIHLEANHRIAIMPDAYFGVNSYGKGQTTIKAGEDIHQYGGTVKAHMISARNYIQHAGVMQRPENESLGAVAEINLTGIYEHQGGTRPDPLQVAIHDRNIDRVVEQRMTTYKAREGIAPSPAPVPSPAPKQEANPQRESPRAAIIEKLQTPPQLETLSVEELEKKFEKAYIPKRDISRTNKDGSATRIRTYTTEMKEGDVDISANLITDAIAAGWTIINQTVTSGLYRNTLILTVQKTAQEMSSEQ